MLESTLNLGDVAVLLTRLLKILVNRPIRSTVAQEQNCSSVKAQERFSLERHWITVPGSIRRDSECSEIPILPIDARAIAHSVGIGLAKVSRHAAQNVPCLGTDSANWARK